MRAVLLALCILTLLPAEGLAQSIRGRVIDDVNQASVVDALVRIYDAGNRTVGSTFTDAQGGFVIPLPASGRFRIEVERLGYPLRVSPDIYVAPSETVEISFRIDPEAILLAPLEVVSRSGGDRGRDQFARRCAEGTGICLDPIHIALIEPAFPTDLFHEIPTLVVDPVRGGMVRRLTGGGCLTFFLNNQIDAFTSSNSSRRLVPNVGVTYRAGGAIGSLISRSRTRMLFQASTLRDNRLDTQLAARDIRGVEIYLNPEDVPDEIMQSRRAWDLRKPGTLGACGAVVLWTADEW